MTPIVSEGWPCTYTVSIICKVVITLHEGKNSLHGSSIYVSCRHYNVLSRVWVYFWELCMCACTRPSGRKSERNDVWTFLRVPSVCASVCVCARSTEKKMASVFLHASTTWACPYVHAVCMSQCFSTPFESLNPTFNLNTHATYLRFAPAPHFSTLTSHSALVYFYFPVSLNLLLILTSKFTLNLILYFSFIAKLKSPIAYF